VGCVGERRAVHPGENLALQHWRGGFVSEEEEGRGVSGEGLSLEKGYSGSGLIAGGFELF